MQTLVRLIPPTPPRLLSPHRMLPSLGLMRLVHRWSISSQQQARRNAMVATTACTDRRAVRLEVEEFLTAHAQVADVKYVAHG